MLLLKKFVARLLCATAALLAASSGRAQTYTVIHAFTGADGWGPGGLVVGSDGDLYGATGYGGTGPCNQYGATGCGTVFKLDSADHLTTLHSFSGTDGYFPTNVIQAWSGNFLGTTLFGGGFGTVFEMDAAGNLMTLHSFDGNDGFEPQAPLVQGTDGNFYGTSPNGGAGVCHGAFWVTCGTIFRMDPSGNVTTLHSFSDGDGGHPTSGLIQARDGLFYGTNDHTVYRIDSSSNFQTLHTFDGAGGEGTRPSSLIQAADGNFYGTTEYGGAADMGTIFTLDSGGNVTTLHSFTGADGANPAAGLIQATDGNFYGTTWFGGNLTCTYGCGTVFKMDTSGTLTTLHTFANSDGANPVAPLVQGLDGSLYGASGGGAGGFGVIFRITTSMTCGADATALCLNGGRFRIQASWADFHGNSGAAHRVPGVSSSDSGLMWFFGPDNWELLIKVLDGCGVNGHYWVLGAAATNVAYTIQVTDTQTGSVRTYTNPLGAISPAITDTAAFGSCP